MFLTRNLLNYKTTGFKNVTAFTFDLNPQYTPAIIWGCSFRLWNTKATTPSVLAYYLDVKESTCNVGDLGLIPELGRSPGGGNGNPLQYFCLENPQWTEGSQRVGHDWGLSTHLVLGCLTYTVPSCCLLSCLLHLNRYPLTEDLEAFL